jgi:hypothetical protein
MHNFWGLTTFILESAGYHRLPRYLVTETMILLLQTVNAGPSSVGIVIVLLEGLTVFGHGQMFLFLSTSRQSPVW